jgi:glycosyltransferase involved in cell wall biosynthesis
MQSAHPRKIIFIESAAAMGGVQFSTLYLAQRLDRSRWKPIVVCPEEGDLTQACRNANVETQVISHSRLWSTSIRIMRNARLPNPVAWIWNALVVIRANTRLQEFFLEHSPDVVVTKGLSSHFIGGLAARKLHIPCVWHVQDFISVRSFGIYRYVFGLAARWLPRQIIVDGASIKKQLPAALWPGISVIHNGVDTNVFRPGLDGSAVRRELGISKGQLVIGHAGRITPWKGQHYLIEAFARIAADQPNVILLFVGSPVFDHDAYERRLRTMAVAFDLQDRIKFIGYRHDLPNVLAAMDIFAFTSVEKDTSPLALLSAMACGLPIVAFDIEGVREVAPENETIHSVRVGDTRRLAKSLDKLIIDRQLRSRLTHSARRAAEKKFNLEQYVNRIEAVLTSNSAAEDTEDFAAERPATLAATSV